MLSSLGKQWRHERGIQGMDQLVKHEYFIRDRGFLIMSHELAIATLQSEPSKNRQGERFVRKQNKIEKIGQKNTF